MPMKARPMRARMVWRGGNWWARRVPYARHAGPARPMIAWRRRSTGRSRILRLFGAIGFLAGAGPLAHAQEPVDSSLLAYITTIRAIDVHAHPMRPVPPGAAADTEFDALP